MSQALIDKLRRARESKIEAGGHTFTVRRPSDAEATLLGGSSPLDLVHRHVVDWDLCEMHLIPGGNPEPAPFSAEVWATWVDDQPALWGPLSDAIISAYRRHVESREAVEKN